MREILQSDLDSAQRGLGMLGKSPSELDALAVQYSGNPDFAGQVIHHAAKQMAAAKRQAGAQG